MRLMTPSNAAWLSRLWPVLLVAALFLVLAVLPFESLLTDRNGLGAWRFARLLAHAPLVPQIVHVGVFAALTFLCVRALEPLLSVSARYVLAFALAFAFGGFVEFVQLFVPSRDSDLFDVVLNGFGALIGCVVGYGFRPKASLA